MLLKLQVSTESKKGKHLAHDRLKSQVDDSKKGIIEDGNCCSCLLACTDSCIIKCCICEDNYHGQCMMRPLCNNILEVLK